MPARVHSVSLYTVTAFGLVVGAWPFVILTVFGLMYFVGFLGIGLYMDHHNITLNLFPNVPCGVHRDSFGKSEACSISPDS